LTGQALKDLTGFENLSGLPRPDKKVILLSLNELSDEPHNAYVKCFASHRQEKEKNNLL